MVDDIANPSDEHSMLREMLRDFVINEVEPQALEHDRDEKFNRALFDQMGELGLLGLTAPPEYGGAGMDATAAVIMYEELSTSDPGFALACLAHSMLLSTISPTMAMRNRRRESCLRCVRVNGLGRWPCRSPMSVPMFWDYRLLHVNAKMAHGSSTAVRCG